MRTIRFFSILLIYSGLILFSDCANAELKEELRYSAIGEKINNNFGDISTNTVEVFTDKHDSIVWFGQFHLFKSALNNSIRIEWIAPNGSLYREHTYKPAGIYAPYTWAKLDLNGEDVVVRDMEGEWTAKVYIGAELIDRKEFWMGYPQY